MSIGDIIPELGLRPKEKWTIKDKAIFSTDEILSAMLSDIRRVDLVSTLENDYEDELLKYRKKDAPDEIDELKIPMDIYIVAIVHEIGKVANRNHWKVAKQHDVIYLFNGMYWKRVSDDQIGAFFGAASAKIGFYSPAKAYTSNFTKNGIEQIYTAAMPMKCDNNDRTVRINLLNGTMEITESGHILKPHDPDDFLTYVLPFEYDAKAIAPQFEAYLNRVLPDHSSQMVLQEFLGYVFIRHLKLEKSLILLGGGQNGKSVMFEIMMELFGRVNVSTKSLGDLTDRDSGNDNRAKLGDKLLNYGSEIRGKDVDVDIFKRLVSGEPVAAREKYKTGFDLENNCKFMFNANKLPSATERTEAYYRRFIIVPFTTKITEEEKDPELHTKIIRGELPGVLNWVIAGLNRLLVQKAFTLCIPAEQALMTYRRESNNIIQFIEDAGILPDNQSFRFTKDVYLEYTNWCKASGYRSIAINDFSTELVEQGFIRIRKSSGRGFHMAKRETL